MLASALFAGERIIVPAIAELTAAGCEPAVGGFLEDKEGCAGSITGGGGMT